MRCLCVNSVCCGSLRRKCCGDMVPLVESVPPRRDLPNPLNGTRVKIFTGSLFNREIH